MKKYVMLVLLSIFSAAAAAAPDQWIIYTDNGYKGVVYVYGSSGDVQSGWFTHRNGSSCTILTGQSFNSNVRSGNISGDIGTTCGIWKVWKSQYAIPAISGTTGNYGSPFGKLFTGKVILG